METRRVTLHHLGPDDGPDMDRLLDAFSAAFEDPQAYASARPSSAYVRRLLESDTFIALAAKSGDQVIGGLVAYELRKFEQERSEIYIYDLAVLEPFRRQGVATRLIEEIKVVAAQRGAYVVFVQADREDDGAIALYSTLGVREDVVHFDISVDPRTR